MCGRGVTAWRPREASSRVEVGETRQARAGVETQWFLLELAEVQIQGVPKATGDGCGGGEGSGDCSPGAETLACWVNPAKNGWGSEGQKLPGYRDISPALFWGPHSRPALNEATVTPTFCHCGKAFCSSVFPFLIHLDSLGIP